VVAQDDPCAGQGASGVGVGELVDALDEPVDPQRRPCSPRREPVEPQRGDDASGTIELAALERSPQRSLDVGGLGVESGNDQALLAEQPPPAVGRQLHDPRQVRVADRVGLGRLVESFARVLTYRFEQAVPARRPVGLDERASDQGVERLEDVEPRDPLGGAERETSREDGQPSQEHALVVVEQVVAPVQRRAHRVLSSHVAPAACQDAELVVEPARQLGERHRAKTSGSELDRQRDAVEPGAHRVDRVDVVDRPWRPLLEQRPGAGAVEPRHRPRALGADAERFPARRQHLRPRRTCCDLGDDLSGGIDHVLAVVEHEEQVAVADRRDQRRRVPGACTRGDGGSDLLGGLERRQLDDAHLPGDPLGDGQRQPRLPAPSGTDDRDDGRLAEELEQRVDLVLAPDEARRRLRHGARRRSAEDRERRRQPVHDQLVEADALVDVAHVVMAEVFGRDTLRQVPDDLEPRRFGEQHLPAVPDVADPGCVMEGEPGRPARAHVDGPGVHGHAHPPRSVGPRLGVQRSLGGDGRSRCGQRRREDGGDAVSLGADHLATLIGDGLTQELVVTRQRVGVPIAEGAEMCGRCLEIGEQQPPHRCACCYDASS
jgi:hypothetical protein